MFFPYSTDKPTKRFPVVTVSLIGINILIFLLTLERAETVFDSFGFIPAAHFWPGIFTNLFLHGGFLHLIFNMWFLWLFGDNVEDKLGRLFFIGFYFFGGVVANLVYAFFVTEEMLNVPCIGASGAVSAIMGAYIVFFPRVRIRALSAFFNYAPFLSSRPHSNTAFFRYVIKIHCSAFLLIGLWFAGQIFSAFRGAGAGAISGVAYSAHIGGFLFGILFSAAVSFFMPDAKIKEKKEQEREEEIECLERIINKKKEKEAASFEDYKKKIESLLNESNTEDALELYRQFVNEDIPGNLSLRNQKIISELFLKRGEKDFAFQALIKIVLNYPDKPEAAEAECRIGLICSRDFKNPSEAIDYLTRGLKREKEVNDPELIEEAQGELEVINKKLAKTFVGAKKGDLSGSKFAIIAQLIKEDLLDAKHIFKMLFKVGEIGGKNLGYKLAYNAEANLKIKDGVVMQKLDSIEATIASEKLQKAGIPVLVIPQSELLSYPHIEEVRGFDLSEKSFILKTKDNNPSYTSSEILYVVVGQVLCSLLGLKELEHGLFEIGDAGEREGASFKGLAVNRIIDIFTIDSKRFRINKLLRENDFPEEKGFNIFSKRLAAFAGGSRIDQKIKTFISSNLWQNLTFSTIKEFDQKTLWAVRLKYAYSHLL